MTEYIGYIAGFLTTFAMLPQVLRVYRLKSAREISLLFSTSILVGVCLWLVYGIVLGLVPLIVWNSIGIGLVGLLLVAKLKYGR